VPNEDSRLVEFDEANLFSLNRFPGSDQKEQGLRANLGVGWTRLEADGRSFGIVAGQVLRLEDPGLFSAGTGLSGVRSDWLLAAHYQGPEGLDLMNRILIDEDMSITQNELRLRYGGERFDLGASFIWQVADPVQDRPIPTRQLTLNTGWTFAEGWTGTAGTRYDLQADKATKASVGLQFRNECTELDLSLSRRFTSSTSVDPVTDFNFQVTLNGFGQRARGQSFRQSCGG
jgi:LPS-assembly protein